MSTTDQLAAAVGAASAPVAKPKTKAPAIVQQVLSDQFKKQLALAVPKHLSADRMARIAATEVRKTPALLNTTPASFLGAVMQSAQLGLEPGSALGQAYLVPYGNQCQLILGYRGMIDLARRSGQVLSLNAYAVREGDEFIISLVYIRTFITYRAVKLTALKSPSLSSTQSQLCAVAAISSK